MEGMIKGYSVLASGQFITDDRALCQCVPEQTLDAIATHRSTIKPGEWYPRSEVLLLWRAIADAGGDEKGAYENLIRCGEFNANRAAGTFLKLLLKMLTPRTFAKKFSDFWAHDHRGGQVAVEQLDAKNLLIEIRDIAGFDHVAVISAGFIGFTLRATGLKSLTAHTSSWSRQKPGPEKVKIEVSWQ